MIKIFIDNFLCYRTNIWGDACVKLNNIADSELCKPFKVQFVGEPAVDHGGPSREFFSLVNQHVQLTMMCGSTFRHNVVSLQNDEFLKFGKLTSKGFLQGSPGPKFFGKTVTDYIIFGAIKCLNPSGGEVPPW